MARITKAQTAKLERLKRAKDKAMQSVYACGNSDDRFSECMAKAKATRPDLAEAFNLASETLRDFESFLVDDCRGYRGTYGNLILY